LFFSSCIDSSRIDLCMDNVVIHGAGVELTTIVCEVRILDRRKNILLSNLTIENLSGIGLVISGGINIRLRNLQISNCRNTGMYIGEGAEVRAHHLVICGNSGHGVDAGGVKTKVLLDSCKIHRNLRDGVSSFLGSVVVLEGEETEVEKIQFFCFCLLSLWRGDADSFYFIPPLHRCCKTDGVA
jgi:hypothetical protein